jgi:minichromosome maintenance protein 10
MSTSSASQRKLAYDPARQWGLKPEPDAGGSTYVISGHIINGSGMDSRSLYATEQLGREGQAKAKRKLSSKDADRALKVLLERDKEGMKAVVRAREVGKFVDGEKSGRTREERAKMNEPSLGDGISRRSAHFKNAYTAEVIKHLGFDPVAKAGQRRSGDSDIQKKVI